MKNEKNVLIDLRTYMGDYYVEAKCISVNPVRSELIAVGVNDPYIRLYDRRMIKPVKVSFIFFKLILKLSFSYRLYTIIYRFQFF